MKVLVTGGTGFLGGHLLRRLIDAGDTVRVLVRPSDERHTSGRPTTHGKLAGAEKMVGDLRDGTSLKRAVNGMEVICHCAAHVRAKGSWSDFEEVTIRGTERLLDLACREGVNRFVHISSLGIYALNGDTTITEESAIDENVASRGHYTRSKVESERLVWEYFRQRRLPVTVIRPGLLYGPGRSPLAGRLCVHLGPKLRIAIGRPQQLLPLAFVENVADAIHLALRNTQAIGRVYNVADDPILQREYLTELKRRELTKAVTILVSPNLIYPFISLLERFCRSIGRSSPVSRHQVERAFASVVYDTSKAREELGWTPQVSLTKALSKMQGAGKHRTVGDNSTKRFHDTTH